MPGILLGARRVSRRPRASPSAWNTSWTWADTRPCAQRSPTLRHGRRPGPRTSSWSAAGASCSPQTGTSSPCTFGVARPDPARSSAWLVPLEEHRIRPQGQPARPRTGGRGRPARGRAEAHPRPDRPDSRRRRCSRGARPRRRTRRATGAAGSVSPSPTTTPATPRAPARPCSGRSPCTPAKPVRSVPVRAARRRGGPRRRRRPLRRAAGRSPAGTPAPHACRVPAARSKASARAGSRRCGRCRQHRQLRVHRRARSHRTRAPLSLVRRPPAIFQAQRPGCCTVRTVATRSSATVCVRKKPTRRRPAQLTHTPARSSRRRGDDEPSEANSRTPPRPPSPDSAMITAASSTYEARSSRTRRPPATARDRGGTAVASGPVVERSATSYMCVDDAVGRQRRAGPAGPRSIQFDGALPVRLSTCTPAHHLRRSDRSHAPGHLESRLCLD